LTKAEEASAMELGISLAELVRHLGTSVPGIRYAVTRGEAIGRENH